MSWPTIPFAFLVAAALIGWAPASAGEAPRITKEELRPMLGSPDLVLIDTRAAGGWKAAQEKIRGAVREDSDEVASWAGKYQKGKTFVVYCA